MKCPRCATDNTEDSRFCKICAAPLSLPKDASPQKTVTLQTPQPGLSKGSILAEKYRILDKLGQGGMGLVYKAEDLKLKRTVALKFLPPESTGNQAARNRFMQEAQAASALDHPNICTIHEISETENGQVFIAMACYEGDDLKQKISNGPILPEETVQIAVQIARGLSKAHARGIVHRDIKPANIMLTDDGTVKIVDFGIAKLSGPSKLTHTGVTMGTVAYMSPEQARGGKVDHRTDIWSLGVVIYEMLTSQLPFQGDHEQAVIYSIINKNPQPLEALCEHCPPALQLAIQRSLRKDTNERFQSVEDLIAVLQDKEEFGVADIDFSDIVIAPAEKELHNLPTQLTSFIGRGKEMQEVKTLLENNRLVTVNGSGGSGKTRLALETAAELVDQYPHGIWFIDLAPLSDPGMVLESVAAGLQIREEYGQPLMETTAARLKSRRLLLLLDNCEHVISACQELVDGLLKACPDVKILATSREILNIPGEINWRIPPLTTPGPEQLNKEKIPWHEYEALSLFVERSAGHMPEFKATPENVSIIGELCARLEGIPLAIELAAARAKLLGPKDILDRLNDRFRLLVTSSHAALPRHKTLRATVDWSYDLLSEPERTLFQRISVFTGGFDLEGVEGVCTSEPLTMEKILDLLSGLVNKSLVVTEPREDGSIRYRMLETLRHYAQEKLFECGEEQSICQKHYDYFLSLAERAYAGRFEATMKWLNRLEVEHDNLRAALEWSRLRPKEQIALSGALYWFWQAHSHYSTGIEYLKDTLLEQKEQSSEVARALTGAGMFKFWFKGNIHESLRLLESSQEIWQDLGAKDEAALVDLEMGQILCFSEAYEKAMVCLERGVDLLKESSDERLLIRGKTFLTFGYICQFQPELAEPIVKPALERALKLGMTKEIMDCRHFYADCAMLRGDVKEGERRYAQALLAALKLGDMFQAQAEMQGMAMCIAGQARSVKAFRLNGAAVAKLEELGITLPYLKFWHDSLNGYMSQARKRLGENAASVADDEGWKMGFSEAVRYALDFDKD